MKKDLSPSLEALLQCYQRIEETDCEIYRRIAERTDYGHEREVLELISEEEKRHAEVWKNYTGAEIGPDLAEVSRQMRLCRFFGYTFVLKKMLHGEYACVDKYREIEETVPEVKDIIADEKKHELQLLKVLEEEQLQNICIRVDGLNNVTAALAGVLAGLTFGLGNMRSAALAGVIAGLVAALALLVIGFLAGKGARSPKAFRGGFCTGAACLVITALLTLPYWLFPAGMCMAALGVMLALALPAMWGFSYYLAVVKSQSFCRRFTQVLAIGLGMAAIAFLAGLLIKRLLGADI